MIIFYEEIGTIYDKSQRLRKLAALLSDELNLNKEKIQVAASISKSDLCSDLVREYPELQGVMGKHFAIAQGFEEDIANAINKGLKAHGTAVCIDAIHQCMTTRGIKKEKASTVTNYYLGQFKDDLSVQNRYLRLISH